VTVAVTVPYWHCQATIRRCVDSILAQSHEDLICVVVNDRDRKAPPWPALEDITDRRLVRFGLRHRNRGRYFIDAMCVQVLRGVADWWHPCDADDWLDRDRLAALLDVAGPNTDAVYSGWTQHHEDGTVVRRPLRPPVRKIRAVAHLSNLWRPGFAAHFTHPGQRVGYDQVMTMAAWTHGTVATVDDWQYHRQLRPGSLTRSPVTGKGTPFRRAQKRHQRVLWARIRAQPTLSAAGKVIAADIPVDLAAAVTAEADRLRARIASAVTR
jgi:glycosyltransferase involved in cell wall biosynthesis